MSSSSYFDLGGFGRPVSTSSVEAQAWFDRGLAWCYGFNFEAAARCFDNALVADPGCAIAHWGLAYASGPNYNKAWRLFDAADFEATTKLAMAALERADALRDGATAAERALIEALSARFAPGVEPAEWAELNLAYAEAMRPVYEAHMDDLDIATLFVDALLCVSPRQLWDVPTGEPVGYGTLEARRILERAFESPAGVAHPGINHLYIHLMEMSPTPGVARQAADRLRTQMPDAGHLAHMATHVDIACGDYRRAVDSGRDAVAGNYKYLATVNGWCFYRMYLAHDLYVLVYAAMMLGRFDDAWQAAQELRECLPTEFLSVESPPMADWAESHVSAYVHVLIRFGRWQEIIDLELPEDRQLYCVTTAMILYAKGVANAATGRVAEAEEIQQAFRAAVVAVPESRMSVPNREVDILRVADAMLDGELEYRKGNFDVAFSHLREAIEREDSLMYADPRSWPQPVRHAYGALLLEQERVDEAAAVYRSDLGIDGKLPRARAHPNNVWSLHGLHEALVRSGDHREAAMIALQRDIAAAAADPINASCACRLSTAAERT